MGDKSTIEWTDATWNPVTGCSKVSPGCAHCYAEAISLRFGRSAGPWTPANAAENVVLHPERLDQPLRWRRPRMVFVNSMSDLFHDEIPDEFICQVFTIMANAPQHTFQVLTKRPERMSGLVRRLSWRGYAHPSGDRERVWWRAELLPDDWVTQLDEAADPLPNVWLGVSIENRRYVGRADLLRQTPAAVRFISAEPLLGPLVKARATTPDTPRVERPAGGGVWCRNCGRAMGTWQWQCAYTDCSPDRWLDGYRGAELDLAGIDWLIVGGESGARHRPMDPQWVRDLRDASFRAGTAFFFKQWGGRTPKAGGRELDGRTWDELPPIRAGRPPRGAVPQGSEALLTP